MQRAPFRLCRSHGWFTDNTWETGDYCMGAMTMTDETTVLSLSDFETPSEIEYVFVPDAIKGKGAWIQSLNAGDMIEFRESNEGPAKKTATLRLIIKSIVDGDGGKPMLKESHLGMLRQLKEKEVNVLGKAILKLNGYEDDAKKG